MSLVSVRMDGSVANNDNEDLEERLSATRKQLNQAYGKVKKTVFGLYYTYEREELDGVEGDIADLSTLRDDLNQAYQDCRKLKPPDNEVRRKVDIGTQMCTDLMEALEHIRAKPLMPAEARKGLLKVMCGQDYAKSVFGSRLSKAPIENHPMKVSSARDQDARSIQSGNSQASAKSKKLIELEAKKKRADLKAQASQHQAALSSIQERLDIVDMEEELEREELSGEVARESPVPKALSIQNPHQQQVESQPSAQKFTVQSPTIEPNDSASQAESQLAFIAQTFADSINKSRLPVPTPPVFDGNPLKFVHFKKSFVALVESKGIQASEKLYHLQQYLTGEAKSAVEGFFFGNDEAAYHSAWKKLERRFGHSFTIQQSLRNKLKAWPRVPSDDGKALQDLCDFLHTLQEAIPYVDGLKVLDDYVQIQDIVSKLPHWCSNRWTRIVTNTMNEGKSYPSFAAFVNFVDVESQVATNPMCASQVPRRTPQAKSTSQFVPKSTHGITHAIHTKEDDARKQDSSKGRPPCALCASQEHTIGRCGQFKQLSYDKKFKFIQDKNLCFKCLRVGHPSRRCPNKIICYTCQRNHHTLLHLDKPVRADDHNKSQTIEEAHNKLVNAEAEETDPVEGISNKAQSNKTQTCTTMALPVWVRTEQDGSQEVLTYALIDTQSDNHYITEDLAEKLNIPHQETRMKLKTMTSVSVLSCRKFCNVKLRGYDMDAQVALESCYTQAHIPYSKDQIPSKASVGKLPHLAHLTPFIPPEQDCEVGLLIGYTCPQAFRPLEVVSGLPEEAFALKTDLGWSVIGGASCGEQDGSICHRVTSKELIAPPPCDVLKIFDQDFKDTKDDVTCSQEDLQELCKEKKPWDEPVTADTAERWEKWKADLHGSSTMWLQGPDFLLEDKLPLGESESTLNLGDPEVKAHCLNTSCTPLQTGLLDRLERFSTWKSMLNALMVLIRKIKGKQSRIIEQRNAANLILKWLQNKEFLDEMTALEKKQEVSSTSSLRDLDPKQDEVGVIRVGGRIQSSQSLSEKELHPIILPRKTHVTQAIIKHIHETTNHGGRSLTLNELRTQGYYVQRGSRVVAQVIHNCVECRKQRRPAESQKMADLPQERTEKQPIFYSSGMDVFGPFLIKRGRSEIKRYGLLFTCLYSRAIHIELLDDLSTDCFINALRCFLALRGVVKTLFCDQGSNFVGGNNELRQARTELDRKKLEVYLASKQVEFKFNVPHASEQGGVWERQIRTVRSVLASVVEFSNARLDDSSLRTLFYEATYIVNSRPLSPVSLNDPLADPPLTPNALLHGRLEGVLPPPGSFCVQDVYARKRWRRVQHLSEMFWNKWKKEYLQNLQQRRKWHVPQRNLKQGDIVLLVSEQLPRSQWPMGIVTDSIRNKDGLVRQVNLKVSNARSTQKGTMIKETSSLQRPVQKVVLLLPADNV